MADATPPTPQPLHPAQPPYTHPNPVAPEENELTIVSHSNLFYWWPVWAMCFLLGVLTIWDNHVAAIVPAGADVAHDATVKYQKTKGDEKADVEVSHQTVVFVADDTKGAKDVQRPHIHLSKNKSYGVLFTFVLLLVIFITNVPLRGMWSLIVILILAFLIVLAAYFEIWDWLFNIVSALDIRLNEGGYFMIGGALFILWLFTFLFFDRQIYIKVTPGNFKVCTEIGGGEKVFDTAGMQLEKQRSDLFRHWILGLGSGDLIVRTSGASTEHFDLTNVLFIGRKVQQIENLIKKKSVVETR
jgi:hypothetical protein